MANVAEASVSLLLAPASNLNDDERLMEAARLYLEAAKDRSLRDGMDIRGDTWGAFYLDLPACVVPQLYGSTHSVCDGV